ncbi:MAG: hypothetical protein HY867_09120 [Chloroflexi bacterium]|nr:hypothetical protein [Chloroflexota bacterium]
MSTSIILEFLRQGWLALAGALLAFSLLAGMAQMLSISSAGVTGANAWVWQSVSALISLLILTLFAFLGIPQIVQALQSSLPGGAGCGPISVLGQYASDLIGGLAAVRMLKATFVSVLSASIGGTSTFSQALIECGEAIFGMLIAAAAIPLAAWFLGTC